MKFLRISILTALHVCLIFLHTSCIREEMNACVQYKLNTQAVDEQGNDLTGNGVLEKSEVYLFGEKGFIRMIPAKASLEYLFGNHKSERLTLVAWGNIKEDTLITIPILPGTSIENARLKLKRHTEGNHLPVTDMFYCRKGLKNTATRSIQEESITLVMKRIAAGLSIHTLHLEEQYPRQEENYTLLIRGTGTEMDFTGKVTGRNYAEYKPLSITDEQGNVHVPPFRIFPTGEEKERV